LLATVAAWLGARVPIIGGPVFGILLGMLIKATGRVDATFKPGITFSSKQLLQAAIVLLGAGLGLQEIWRTGASSLAVMLTTLAACLLMAWLAGKALGIPGDLTTLVGVGTAICGASAIAATAPVIEAEEKDVAYAVSTIFFFNVLAVLLFPPIGRLLGLGQGAFGLWAGTAVNDTSSVVAAAYSYGAEAGAFATVVKLTRTTMIIPVVLALSAWRSARARRESGPAARVSVGRLVPWFLVGFLCASLLTTLGLIPAPAAHAATTTAKFLIVVALTGVGLSADFRQMARTGFKPLLLGALLWATVAVTSLAVQRLTGQWL
jgi:uncharacterized integral membrane protein (TIGR00698 family)